MLSEFDGIAQKVRQHLLEAQRVDQYPLGQLGGYVELHAQALEPGIALEDPGDRFDQSRQLSGCWAQAHVPRFNAYHIEDIADQLEQTLGAVGCDLQGEAVELTLLGLFQGDFQHTDHSVHGRSNLVAHGRQEARLGPARCIRLVLGLAQCFEQMFTFLQLVFQGLFGGGPLFDQCAQIHVPDDKTQYQRSGHGADLQDQCAVVAPEAVADHRIGSPAVGQLGHFVRRDAQ
ncbi:hypothetical protein D3C76_827950 [compost metagenome]